MTINGFNRLSSHAINSIEEHHARPGMAEVFAKKNFCATLQLREIVNQFFTLGAKTEELDCTEYGSTALYSKLLHRAVDELLSQPKALLPKERAALVQWKAIDKDTLGIGAIYDLFRVRLPGVISNLVRGNNPLGSFLTQAFGWFYLPSHQEYKDVAQGIVEKIENLKCGDRMLIPYGTISHETLLYVEKDHKGALSIKLFDPNMSRYGRIIPSDPKNFTECAWWEKVVRSKMLNDNWEAQEPLLFKVDWESCESGILPIQKRNTCFAHCHWSFLRFFLKQNFSSSLAAQSSLENKIKNKIYELSCPENDPLMRVARLCLEKQNLKHQLIPQAKEATRLMYALLKGAKQKNYLWNDHSYSVKSIKNQIHVKEKDFRKNKNLSKRLLKTVLDLGYWNYAVFQKQLESWKRSSSSVKKNFATLLETKNKLHQEYSSALVLRLKKTVDVIEAPKGILAQIYRFIVLSLPGANSLESFENRVEQCYGVNKWAFNDLFRQKYLTRLWSSLSTPQEVLQWSKRILAIAEKFKARPYYAAYVKASLSTFIEKNQFQSKDREWLNVKPILHAMSKLEI